MPGTYNNDRGASRGSANYNDTQRHGQRLRSPRRTRRWRSHLIYAEHVRRQCAHGELYDQRCERGDWRDGRDRERERHDHTNAGTTIRLRFFTGGANYDDIGNTTVTDSIAKATATVVVTPYTCPVRPIRSFAHGNRHVDHRCEWRDWSYSWHGQRKRHGPH